MTEEQWLLTHLESITKWVMEKRDYAKRNFCGEYTIPDKRSSDRVCYRFGVMPEFKDANGTFFIDLRLQYHNEELIPHSGLSDYDQDHRGNWSSSAVEWCAKDKTCANIALALLKDLWNEIPEAE